MKDNSVALAVVHLLALLFLARKCVELFLVVVQSAFVLPAIHISVVVVKFFGHVVVCDLFSSFLQLLVFLRLDYDYLHLVRVGDILIDL